MKAWHFLSEGRKLGYGDGRVVRPGKTIKVDCKPVLCQSGLHGSVRLIDALQYSAGPIICRVDISGQLSKGEDKIVGTERTVEWMFDATNVLHRFACKVAERALKTAKVEDERCWNAIRVKLAWLEGKATDDELAAARDAAWDAAWAAARDAAWAAARAAARAAAWAAARAAAWAAARDAAWDTAWAAARAAAWDAAWAAARDAQNRTLSSMVHAEARRLCLKEANHV